MESTIAGFLAQLKGRINGRRYYYATVFMDHYSDYTYMHMLSEQITSKETIKANQARFRSSQLNDGS